MWDVCRDVGCFCERSNSTLLNVIFEQKESLKTQKNPRNSGSLPAAIGSKDVTEME